jgi:malonyl-CoA O-methyltransferase
MNDKHTHIQRTFSRAAQTYDAHASSQSAVARMLIERMRDAAATRILDVGCGTGTFTGMLYERFPAAAIHAIDISERMIEKAQKKYKNSGLTF